MADYNLLLLNLGRKVFLGKIQEIVIHSLFSFIYNSVYPLKNGYARNNVFYKHINIKIKFHINFILWSKYGTIYKRISIRFFLFKDNYKVTHVKRIRTNFRDSEKILVEINVEKNIKSISNKNNWHCHVG